MKGRVDDAFAILNLPHIQMGNQLMAYREGGCLRAERIGKLVPTQLIALESYLRNRDLNSPLSFPRGRKVAPPHTLSKIRFSQFFSCPRGYFLFIFFAHGSKLKRLAPRWESKSCSSLERETLSML